MFKFKNITDAKDGLSYMLNKLEERKAIFDQKDEFSLSEKTEEIIEKLETEYNYLKTSNFKDSAEEFIDEYWEKIKELYETQLKSESSRKIEWAEWRILKTYDRKHGYPDAIHEISKKSPNFPSTVSYYNSLPPKVRWPITKVEQKEYMFFTATAVVEEIEAVSSVPSMPEKLTSEESGKRVLDKERAMDEWQREVNWKRVLSISNFIDEKDTIIANAPILYIHNEAAAQIIDTDEGSFLEIDFEQFLKRPSSSRFGSFVDHKVTYDEYGDMIIKDLRPIWLIDGQHRVRGLADSIEGSKLEIPIVIISNQHHNNVSLDPLSMVAKIFTEINTLQEPLKKLHELFLMHRFSIKHPLKNSRNFEEWDRTEPLESDSLKNSRANHLSYELCSKLASDRSSILFNRVQIHEQNSKKTSIISADQWLEFTRQWFLNNGPYNPEINYTEDFIYNEVNNFLSALVNTCNHDGWYDGRERWNTAISQKKTLIQESTQFQMILELYPLIHSLAQNKFRENINNENDSIISMEMFMEVLKPLKWVDWTSSTLAIFRGGGERGRRTFQIWVEDALEHDISYPLEEVMSRDIHSEPGRGIIAHPADTEVSLKGDIAWPTKRNPVIVSSTRPKNTMRVCTWQIFDDKDHDITEMVAKINSKSGPEDIAYLTINYNKILDDTEYIDIRASWRNTVEPAGIGKLKLEKTVIKEEFKEPEYPMEAFV